MKPYVSQQNTKLMQIAIVKYNAGNIRSVVNALQRIGCNPVITDSPEALMSADKIIFPGQGAAGETMKYLKEHNLDRLICALRQPVLGICIGQQLMCRHSEEDNTDCLGIFSVDVKRFVPTDSSEKVPAMGWNNIHNLKTGLFEHVGEDDFVYFVHSFSSSSFSRFSIDSILASDSLTSFSILRIFFCFSLCSA